MRHTDSRILIDRGRRAGLGTAEIYNALGARPPEAGDHLQGETDGNGFIPVMTTQGRRVYQPAEGAARG